MQNCGWFQSATTTDGFVDPLSPVGPPCRPSSPRRGQVASRLGRGPWVRQLSASRGPLAVTTKFSVTLSYQGSQAGAVEDSKVRYAGTVGHRCCSVRAVPPNHRPLRDSTRWAILPLPLVRPVRREGLVSAVSPPGFPRVITRVTFMKDWPFPLTRSSKISVHLSSLILA